MKADTIDIFDVVQDAIAANNDAGSYYIANATLEAIHEAGYAIVPREPTEAMVEAGQAVDGTITASRVYAAMIEAAVSRRD